MKKRIAIGCSVENHFLEKGVVEIYAPVKMLKNQWACEYVIKTQKKKTSFTAYGVDSLQALALAFVALKAELSLLQSGSGVPPLS
jgi:hypothetical protein